MRTPTDNSRNSRNLEQQAPNKRRHNSIAIVMVVILVCIVAAGIYILKDTGKLDNITWLNNSSSQVTSQNTPAQTQEAVLETIEPSATESATTTAPQATKKVYIPDIDELQELLDPKSVMLTENMINLEIMSDVSMVNWNEHADASYYVLAIYNSKYEEVQKDILWAEITSWQVPNFTSGKVVLYVYKDMGEASAADDQIIDIYSSEVLPVDGEVISFSPNRNKYYLIVDKSSFAFSVFTYDENGEYTVLLHTFPCALGTSDRMTTVGVWEISSKGPWKDWGTGAYSPYYCRFTAGLYMHGSLYDGRNLGNMYTNSYEDIGIKATSGCIRTTVEGAEWVYYNCPAGTIIEIVEYSDLVVYPGKPAIDPDYPRWDPTDPNKPGNKG